MFELDGKTVLVTGGSRGIGAAIVRTVGSLGAQVLLHYGQREDAARAVQAEIGPERCHLIRADLSDPAGATALWRGACEQAGRIDVLVNNAGVYEAASIDGPIEDWHAVWSRVLQINLLAPADLCREAILHFRQHGGGKIINISSRAAFRGEAPDQMPYGASKGALVTLTKTIARGYAKEGVLAFGIAPGFTDTDMVTERSDPEALKRVLDEIPLGTMTSAKEVGALTAFLCSDHAHHLTGATFDVNGASYPR
ncbi:MAG: SDR family NAD(P)-dependent oxidoreductase [Alphaproteobacteria bacterium]